jgi:hypothetical protein
MDVDGLYGLPLERFVAERTALARELRAAGHRDEAGAVAALRKPSVAARAVNQLAREHRRPLDKLFAAGDALSAAQSDVLAGRSGGHALAEAAERERAAVSALVDAARGVLTAEGLTASASVLERVGETLHAAALDATAREPVDRGRLEREMRHVGLGIGAGGDVGALARPGKRQPSEAAPKSDTRAHAAAARRRAQAIERAQAAADKARRDSERAAKAVAGAERKRARAADALARADEALGAAGKEARAADQARREAERELRRLES